LFFEFLLAGCDLTGDTEPQSPSFTVADDLDERITSLDSGNAANPSNLTGINSVKSTNLDVQEIADDPDE
jgi:hypothetical protein